MRKTVFLAGVAMLALSAGRALAMPAPGVATIRSDIRAMSPGHILYSQNDDYGYSIISQNFTSGSHSTWNAAGADDFVVPQGKTWKVTEVDVAGQYFYLSGPARSEVITFYTNNGGHPGTVIGRPRTVNCTDTSGSFACTIRGVTLTGGKKRGVRYWLSVVANCDYATCGEWGWVQTTTTRKAPGQWENPGGGISTTCTSWKNTSSCFSESGVVDDFAFDLRGKSY